VQHVADEEQPDAEQRLQQRQVMERLRWASATIWTICDRTVSAPILSDWMISEPVELTVAPMTRSRGFL
jgi:hypothetical protein